MTHATSDTKQPSPPVPEAADTAPPRKSPTRMIRSHWRFVGFTLLLMMLIGTYLWKNFAVSRAKAQLVRQAAAVITTQNESALRLAAMPLVWAVRSEMLRGNYDQINQYLAQLVQEPNMKEVIVARTDGKVLAATDKKRESAPLTQAFPEAMLRVETIAVSRLENDDILVVAPLLGLNDRLGTLLLVAAPPAYTLDAPSR